MTLKMNQCFSRINHLSLRENLVRDDIYTQHTSGEKQPQHEIHQATTNDYAMKYQLSVAQNKMETAKIKKNKQSNPP